MTVPPVPVPADPGAPGPGDRLGPYRIVRWLGRGGMGTVYEAIDTTLGRSVALKLIVDPYAADPAFRSGFVREAKAQASLDSPHVVQVFAHGEIDGRLYLASQLVPDGDLAAALRRHGRLPAGEALELVAQVADGLAEAHRAGLVHRDVKASNVLLRRRGTHTVAYLADFGIAGPAGGDSPADDVRALVRLLRDILSEAPEPELARLLAEPPATAAGLRDALRAALHAEPAPTPRRRRAALAAAALVVVAGGAAVMAPEEVERSPATHAALADSLERDAGLDRSTARCTARALVRAHGPRHLEDLPADVVLTAAAGCLWAT
ncbi:serine/threonine protein kinase [Nocardioides albidus]|uniref:non-specific serine/threonine protein kinase n=1 Tax=Nocardioides albidus TaxID=1517589 RepID=A0A5C4WR41_9ACTN|nr:serine/threonine-protein kinase [Nocardioides albidus]TNM50145.1 serine/threonine protein kinase [Nocardioides albidus]